MSGAICALVKNKFGVQAIFTSVQVVSRARGSASPNYLLRKEQM